MFGTFYSRHLSFQWKIAEIAEVLIWQPKEKHKIVPEHTQGRKIHFISDSEINKNG